MHPLILAFWFLASVYYLTMGRLCWFCWKNDVDAKKFWAIIAYGIVLPAALDITGEVPFFSASLAGVVLGMFIPILCYKWVMHCITKVTQ